MDDGRSHGVDEGKGRTSLRGCRSSCGAELTDILIFQSEAAEVTASPSGDATSSGLYQVVASEHCIGRDIVFVLHQGIGRLSGTTWTTHHQSRQRSCLSTVIRDDHVRSVRGESRRAGACRKALCLSNQPSHGRPEEAFAIFIRGSLRRASLISKVCSRDKEREQTRVADNCLAREAPCYIMPIVPARFNGWYHSEVTKAKVVGVKRVFGVATWVRARM